MGDPLGQFGLNTVYGSVWADTVAGPYEKDGLCGEPPKFVRNASLRAAPQQVDEQQGLLLREVGLKGKGP